MFLTKNLKKKIRDNEADVRTAYNTLVSSIEHVKALEKAVSITQANYEQQEKDHRFKLATNLDVLSALTSFQDTKRTLDKTRYLVFNSVAQLKSKTNQVGE